MIETSRGIGLLAVTTHLDDAKRALETLLATPGIDVDTAAFERAFEIDRATASTLYLRASVVLLGVDHPIAWTQALIDEVADRIATALNAFHDAHPDDLGMPARQLKDAVPDAISTKTYLALLRHLGEQRIIEWHGPRIRLRAHGRRSDTPDRALWERCLARLLERGMHPFTAHEIAREIGISMTVVSDLLQRRETRGELSRLDAERYLTATQVATLAATAAEVASESGGDGLTAARFRDVVGTGRNLTVRILQFLDDLGVTRRHGDIRMVVPDFELLAGLAPSRRSTTMPKPSLRSSRRRS